MAALVVLAVRFGAELPPDIVATALQPECILHVPPLPGSRSRPRSQHTHARDAVCLRSGSRFVRVRVKIMGLIIIRTD
jgi:hypothetical protein